MVTVSSGRPPAFLQGIAWREHTSIGIRSDLALPHLRRDPEKIKKNCASTIQQITKFMGSKYASVIRKPRHE